MMPLYMNSISVSFKQFDTILVDSISYVIM